ncbi:hypothetical protein ACLOJK_027659 [Asimina triloba]
MRKGKSGPEMDGGTAAGCDLDGSVVDRDSAARVVNGGNGDRGRVAAGGSSKSNAGSGQMGRAEEVSCDDLEVMIGHSLIAGPPDDAGETLLPFEVGPVLLPAAIRRGEEGLPWI